MKIVHILPAFTKGGAEQVVVTLANEAARNGHEVTIVAAFPVNPDWLQKDLIETVRLLFVGRSARPRIKRYLLLLPWLARNWGWLRQQDIVHCHLTFGAAVGTMIWLLRSAERSKRPRIVETYHAAGMPIRPWQRSVLGWHSKFRDAYALIGEDRHLLALQQRSRNPVRIIHNALGAWPLRPEKDECQAFRAKLAIPPTARILGTVGRMVAERRPMDLLAAFAEAASILEDLHFVMGGEGPVVEVARSEAGRLGLGDRVHLPGLVLRPQLAIATMDLYLSVNVGPITGIAGLEAAALGVPVIAFQAMSGRLSQSEDWIWSTDRSDSLGREAASLLQRPEQLAELANRQRAYVLVHHAARTMVDAYFNLYEAAGVRAEEESD